MGLNRRSMRCIRQILVRMNAVIGERRIEVRKVTTTSKEEKGRVVRLELSKHTYRKILQGYLLLLLLLLLGLSTYMNRWKTV